MSHYKKIFTDFVKDTIGNEPVLDQFDISYVDSFYGTFQDDYVTGTMVREIKSPVILGLDPTTRYFVTGTRGRAFSIYYAEAQVPLSETSQAAIAASPLVSSRLRPASTKGSHNYRISQHVDGTERFYDTCLPSLGNSFTVDGAAVWAYTGSIPGDGTQASTVSNEDDIAYIYSPYKNVDTTDVGHMFFNSLEIPRPGFNNDPLVNNNWTWSYPYETKYNPTVRFLKSQDALGLKATSLVANKNGTRIARAQSPKKIDRFVPILPGRNLTEKIFYEGGRNGIRPITLTSGYFTGSLLPSGSALDNIFGVSRTIPADVDLSTTVSHTYLPVGITQPADAPLTGAMTYEDTIKFLYGFGDVNTMTYGAYDLDLTKMTRMYWQGFEKIGATDYGNTAPSALSPSYPMFVSKLGAVGSATASINWGNSPNAGGWSAVTASADALDVTGVRYNFLSQSSTTGRQLYYVRWKDISSIGSNDDYVLASASERSVFPGVGGKIINDYIPDGATSTAVVDVTASNPWNFTYDRAIHADPTDYFYAYWEGYPGYPSHTDPPIVGIDLQQGTYVSGTAGAYSTLTPFTGFSNTLFPPGEYRIAFSYVKVAGGTQGDIDRAFINNFRIDELNLLSNPQYAQPVTSGYTIGGNNYPDFYRYKIDTRFNPIAGTVTTPPETGVTGSAAYYASLHYGVSPIIRGWKYGLYSGLPMHTKATYRRDRFGQLRDTLEQRPYTRFVFNETETEPFPDAGRLSSVSSYTNAQGGKYGNLPSPGPVEVKFVRQVYETDAKGIGYIRFQSVQPEQTYSQNLSTEATSSQPYTDGMSRLRGEYPTGSLV
jgi:hypothetical protein